MQGKTTDQLRGSWHNFSKYRPLIRELVTRDLKVKYRRSFLGYVWSILNPLLMMLLQTLVFSYMFRFQIENFPLYLICGNTLFNFFNESTNMGMGSVLGNSSLIKKVYVPKFIFPISRVVSSFVNLLFSLAAIILVMLITRSPFHLTILLVWAPLVLLFLFTCGMALLLSHWLTKWMMKPVERAVRALDQAGVNADSYAELKPFFSHIQAQDQEIHTQKEILEQEREILGIITNNMREGLLLVSKDKNVVSVNPSAIHMLAGRVADPSEFIGKNYLIVNRTQELHDCVTTALSGASLNDDFTMHGRVYHIYASPMLRLGEVDGAVVIVLDETQQRMAERSRQEFSANVSHELKTPLTSISGYAEMMENGMVASMDDIRKFSGSIHKESLRLIALIDDIIRLSRIEEEVKEPQSLEPVELDDLCEAVMESLEPVAKKAEVSLHLETCPAVLLGEDGMLSELVYNLCENAIKYNHPNGNVWLSLSQDEKEITIKVKDDGIGIPEESRLRVFERFYRVDKSHSKQIGGTGLGLSIVKHVVEYHHGRVELDSGLGVGTEIRVFLPKVIE